jgi:imidazolonepropionase-like amidohydrolase
LADLLVVDGDPLEDISLLQDQARIAAVMKGGALVKDELAALHPPDHGTTEPAREDG